MFVRLEIRSWKNNQELPICQNREEPLQIGVAKMCSFEVTDCLIPRAFTRYASGILGIFFEAEWIVTRKGNEFDP